MAYGLMAFAPKNALLEGRMTSSRFDRVRGRLFPAFPTCFAAARGVGCFAVVFSFWGLSSPTISGAEIFLRSDGRSATCQLPWRTDLSGTHGHPTPPGE